ncbi:related to protoporphyrinogen oxidase [Fusarium fujikuroi IMI 58289]|uniref:Related to protoporphyrinogen oxidase n=1 Tax=Gibberella fujikuroi (strain CBS 195.34 / IMI 58289 / NRRL A-6831) TaxID=1279085 RepID=S0EA11_GIBF5|nr:related to protoporphyrinogen oxidase [Fusarium fujikuroi IMI 58289]KLP00885.1 protoporphyrinogen oxidase [Fusarium fujikuroi]CCT69328.1 related to protoporphyrinogen oxidase [Fusarium fujikuroi IMI 58289]SCN93949.1 related to protoporphyrinogen oxidase [Fusarium fujikuroi]
MSSITGTPATWVVVGASRGIGLEYVKQLLQAGNRVIATARNPDASGLSAVVKARGNPEDCIIEKCDVASSESIDNFAARMSALVNKGVRFDNIVMNAGVLRYPNRATELSYDNFKFHMETNTIGPIICAQKLVNLNPEGPPSKLIFISSDSGSTTNFLAYEDGFAAYAASKAALNQMLRHMAQELKRRGGKWAEICVLALRPGEVHTDMNSGEVGTWDVGTLLEPDESVEGMLKVISEKNHNDTGTFWCWDGRAYPW